MSEPKNTALVVERWGSYDQAFTAMKTNDQDLLLKIVTRYFAAANRRDVDGATDCFAPDAMVRDERKDYHGRAAIRDWIVQTSEAAHPQVRVARAETIGATVILTGIVSGTFPGSPVELGYEFLLQNGKIAQLTIQ